MQTWSHGAVICTLQKREMQEALSLLFHCGQLSSSYAFQLGQLSPDLHIPQ